MTLYLNFKNINIITLINNIMNHYYQIGKYQISNYVVLTDSGIHIVKNTETNAIFRLSNKQLEKLIYNNTDESEIKETKYTKKEIDDFNKRGKQIYDIFNK